MGAIAQQLLAQRPPASRSTGAPETPSQGALAREWRLAKLLEKQQQSEQ